MAKIDPEPSSVPRLRIGVTGHRENKLDAGERVRLRREVDAVLAHMQQVLAELSRQPGTTSASPQLQAISSLAEGADRLFANAALDAGIELVAPIPFARDVYAQDFGDVSRAAYDALLDRAAEVIALDGRYDSEATRRAAYEAVGAAMIERSDIILALWDGEQASGRGGTAEIVALARRRHRPVLWLPTGGQSPTRSAPRLLLSDQTIETGAIEALMNIARTIVKQRMYAQ